MATAARAQALKQEVSNMMGQAASMDAGYPWWAVEKAVAAIDPAERGVFLAALHQALVEQGNDPSESL